MRHDNDTPPTQSTALPLLLSVLVHGAVAGALFLYTPTPKPSAPVGIETSLISQGEIAEIEGAIRENAKAQSQAIASSQATQKSVNKPSPAVQKYNEALAKREAEFAKQVAKFNANQEAMVQAQIDAYEAELKAEETKAQKELEEARKAYQNRDDITEQNKKELEEANAETKNQAKKQTDKANQDNKDGQKDKNSTATGNQSSATPSGTNASTTKSTQSGAGKAGIQEAVARHIKAHWNPIGEAGTRLNTHIKVDANGTVLSVKVTGGTDAQRKSLEDAIYASSPITPIVGTEFRSFSPYFVVE